MDRRAFLLTGMALAGCAPRGADNLVEPSEDEIAELAQAIAGLRDDVQGDEATRAARIAFTYAAQLAEQYEIEDGPITHNRKVNRGEKPRGLCWHWAEDMEARLDLEGFASLEMERAIANGQSPILLAHSTAVIVPKGAPMEAGIVLDPWRYGGQLFWDTVAGDTRYRWRPREVVLAEKRGRLLTGQPANDL